MTITEAISRADALKFNTYSREEKIKWLSELDGSIQKTVMDRYQGGASAPFIPYGAHTAEDTVLLVEPPFDSVYLRWLEAQIDYHNGEYDKYNASILLFNTAFEAFAHHYGATHMPRGRLSRFVF